MLTCENHTVVGGLFETVASAVVRRGIAKQITPIGAARRVSGRGCPADTARTLRPVEGADRRHGARPTVRLAVDRQVLTIEGDFMSVDATSLLRLEKTSLREQALTALRKAITTGQLPPSTHLVETELSEALQISRGTLREAMRQLQQEGLISAGARGRLSVRHLDTKEIRDIFNVRAALESLAARELAAQPDRAQAVTALRAVQSTIWTLGGVQPGGPHRS